MFKKPLSHLKTSAPLRSSDRRKLKQRVVQSFPQITSESGDDDADLLVPEGLLSVKFSTHLEEPGVAYLAPNGDPLWFTVGKGSEDLIPTVYALWKRSDLLPFLSTPAAVIPVLVGGADLMIPGVVQHTPSLVPDQLVAITQYHPGKLGPPLAVGQMVVASDGMREDGKKGKAVYVFHTWKDSLWELGSGGEVPEPREVAQIPDGHGEEQGQEARERAEEGDGSAVPTTGVEAQPEVSGSTLSPQEVTAVLRTSLLQAISTNLSKLPPSSFPIIATVFYSSHILPSRPFIPPSSTAISTPIDIKNSSHKSLTTFLKAMEKEGLIKLKDQKAGKGTELVIMGVFPKHDDVIAHRSHTTLKQMEEKQAKKEEREEVERNKVKEIGIKEYWKAWQSSVGFIEGAGGNTSTLYTMPELKALIAGYIASHNLVNPNDQSYINVDPLLASTLSSKNSTEQLEFIKRDKLTHHIVDKMQPWHEISVEGKEAGIKKGTLKPISVVVKIRQGRKASTLVTNFEPFLVTAEFLAEELRRICASATSVSPVQGKSSGMEVLVQGKQIEAVTRLLVSKGVPKQWIEASELLGKKK